MEFINDASDLYHGASEIKRKKISKIFSIWRKSAKNKKVNHILNLTEIWIDFTANLLHRNTIKALKNEKQKSFSFNSTKWKEISMRLVIKHRLDKFVRYKEKLERIKETSMKRFQWNKIVSKFLQRKNMRKFEAIFHWNIIIKAVANKSNKLDKEEMFRRAKNEYKWNEFVRKARNRQLIVKYPLLLQKSKWNEIVNKEIRTNRKHSLIKMKWKKFSNDLEMKNNATKAAKLICEHSKTRNCCWTSIAKAFIANSTLSILYRTYQSRNLQNIADKYSYKAKWTRWSGKILWMKKTAMFNDALYETERNVIINNEIVNLKPIENKPKKPIYVNSSTNCIATQRNNSQSSNLSSSIVLSPVSTPVKRKISPLKQCKAVEFSIQENSKSDNKEEEEESEILASSITESFLFTPSPTHLAMSPPIFAEKGETRKKTRLNTSPSPVHSFVTQSSLLSSTCDYNTVSNNSLHVYFDLPSSTLSSILCLSYQGGDLEPAINESLDETINEISMIIPQATFLDIIEHL